MERKARNYEETILVSLILLSSWQSIRPSYPKIPSFITSGITSPVDPSTATANPPHQKKKSIQIAGRSIFHGHLPPQPPAAAPPSPSAAGNNNYPVDPLRFQKKRSADPSSQQQRHLNPKHAAAAAPLRAATTTARSPPPSRAATTPLPAAEPTLRSRSDQHRPPPLHPTARPPLHASPPMLHAFVLFLAAAASTAVQHPPNPQPLHVVYS